MNSYQLQFSKLEVCTSFLCGLCDVSWLLMSTDIIMPQPCKISLDVKSVQPSPLFDGRK